MKFFFLSVMFLPLCTLAKMPPSLFLVSGDYRFEKGMDQNIDPELYFNFAGSFLAQLSEKEYYFGLEYFQSPQEVSGVPSLNYSLVNKGLFVTALTVIDNWNHATPYISIGAGFSQQTVTTNLLGNPSTDTSRSYMTGFGGMGLRIDTGNSFFMSVEGRLLFGENQSPQPSVEALCRIGFYSDSN